MTEYASVAALTDEQVSVAAAPGKTSAIRTPEQTTSAAADEPEQNPLPTDQAWVV
jgi:hypothetical protein